jgi:PII-like signaling protein
MRPGPALLLRIYVGERDHHDGSPLYEAIVRSLHDRGIAGATVLRGIEGYGADARIHTTRILSLAMELPVVIEAVEEEAKLRAFLPELDAMMGSGLVTLQPVEVIADRRPGGAS